MAKKSRTRNRKKTHRKSATRASHSDQHANSNVRARHDSYRASTGAAQDVPASYSGRHSYIQEIDQQRSGSVRMPLTNRNLQTLREQSDVNRRNGNFALAVDMDLYNREHQFRDSFGRSPEDTDRISLYSGDPAALSLEFGQSNPSSDHSSDSTSLDDVCFPDYYDGLRNHGANDRSHVWPDLSVLTDFIMDEQADLKESMEDTPGEVNFQFPIARKVSSGHLKSGLATQTEPGPRPSKAAATLPATREVDDVSPTTEDTPLMNSIQVDETASMQSDSSSLRVRPKAIQPWEKSQELPPILQNSGARKSDPAYRFTYFREDIETTVHSPTLSGLVSDTNNPNMTSEQVTNKLQFMFPPSDEPITRRGSVESAAASTDAPVAYTPSAAGSGVMSTSHSRNVSQKADSPMPQSMNEILPLTATNSGAAEKHQAPFWLDITDPSEEEMKVISKTFGLHPLTTEDIFLGETREKVDMFRSYYFVCFTSFDIVYERRKQRAMEHEKKSNKMMEYDSQPWPHSQKSTGVWKKLRRIFGDRVAFGSRSSGKLSKSSTSLASRTQHVRTGELCPLNMYMIVFNTGVLTFHFNATPHPINVRRRMRMLKDHLNVSSDWLCYALIDDITDSFAPMIDSIEQEVYSIEDSIMKLHSSDFDSSDSEDNESDSEPEQHKALHHMRHANDVFYRRQRSKSVVEPPGTSQFLSKRGKRGSGADYLSLKSGRSSHSRSSYTSSSKSTSSKIVAWRRKGDMLRRIGECRKRVMSVMRLLSTKPDVIKGFSKRFNDSDSVISTSQGTLKKGRNGQTSRQEILMYFGDIQDHIMTMIQSLNHYEKLLARSHSNYLAQINIDMTKVNNDTNDILGKVTILGTIVLPINVVTGLWGMNCIVPGQDHEGLVWFYGILVGITMFSVASYIYARKVTGL